MVNIHEFKSIPYKFNNKERTLKSKVWNNQKEKCSVVLLVYGYGKNINDEEIEQLANNIIEKHDMSVVCVEYGGTNLKYNDNLLRKLEIDMPRFLNNISPFLKKSYQKMIDDEKYQEVANTLYFDAITRYFPLRETIIPLYGDDNEYMDYGLVDSIDILNGLEFLKNAYPELNWNDCIGYGKDYGAYLIQMIEKIKPGTFSMTLNLNLKTNIEKEDLFCNLTEWDEGKLKLYRQKYMGKFLLYLVDKFGWTTNTDSEKYFTPNDFDIRNIKNKMHIEMNNITKCTPQIFVDLKPDEEFKKSTLEYVDLLIKNDYILQCWKVELDDIDGSVIKEKDNSFIIDEIELFNYYINQGIERNTEKYGHKDIWYPVYKGVYLFYRKNNMYSYKYINIKNSDLDFSVNSFNNSEQLTKYLKNPIKNIDFNYELLSEINK